MNSTENINSTPGTETTKGEKIAMWAIFIIIAYLFWNQ